MAILKPGVVLASAQGEVADEEDSQTEAALLAELDSELARVGTLTLFADLRESPRMPKASRKLIAQWVRRHQARLRPTHVLVQSRPIELALSVIAMLVGGGLIKVHTRPQHFLELVRKVAPKLTELPAVPERD